MKLNKNKVTLNQISSLVEYAFLKNYDVQKDINFKSRYNHSDDYGEFHNGKLESYVMVNSFKSQIFNRKVKMAGVGYVASYPENRGHGDISKIMKEILLDLHSSGVAFSNLAPWSETFYRQYGYENTIYQKSYVINPEMFRHYKVPKKGKVLRGKWNDRDLQEQVLNLYRVQLESGNERNTVIRQKWWWNRLDSYYPGRFIAVYVDENSCSQAYMFYRIINSQFCAEEIYFSSKEGALALLNFIGGHISTCTNFKIIASEESMIEDYFPEQKDLKITISPYMMSRIIDFAKIASCINFGGANEVNLEVKDDQICNWNNGVWKLTRDSGEIKCTKTKEKPNYSGTITNWTKVLLGHLTLSQAVNLELIEANSSNMIEFVKGKVSFYDYF